MPVAQKYTEPLTTFPRCNSDIRWVTVKDCFDFRSSASVATGEAPRYGSFNFFACGDCGGVHNSIRATYAWHMRPLRLPRARRVRSS